MSCAVCGDDLHWLTPYQRQLHVNACLDGERPASDREHASSLFLSSPSTCFLCGKTMEHWSGEWRQRHIERCLASQQVQRLVEAERARQEREAAVVARRYASMRSWCASLGLARYLNAFIAQQVDEGALRVLHWRDADRLGMSGVAARRWRRALQQMEWFGRMAGGRCWVEKRRWRLIWPPSRLGTERRRRGASAPDRVEGAPDEAHTVESIDASTTAVSDRFAMEVVDVGGWMGEAVTSAPREVSVVLLSDTSVVSVAGDTDTRAVVTGRFEPDDRTALPVDEPVTHTLPPRSPSAAFDLSQRLRIAIRDDPHLHNRILTMDTVAVHEVQQCVRGAGVSASRHQLVQFLKREGIAYAKD
ncbi:hypothetical protein CDCA_CDCA01G0198 [Cyanidium caldarium]|uniref:Structure-specific endonuclease subunit SLX4 n=1 Tax=Cyanidium caldarium TaxID=2771 RepID=A0AAV9IQ78_CYACA|nr:hypothetical protein CDCA_CDCA01G0198 [Cyanidium caldarium]